MKNKLSLTIINCRVNDSSDYEWMYENGIHNTINRYFQWADSVGTSISFEKQLLPNDTALTLNVNATFKNKHDMSMFKLSFGTEPKKSLKSNDIMEFYFE